ncbi:hypothetical protein FC682_02015 [Peribacillus simplex]|uniref:hypothetical protein n=1 Tax=Peribacillus simplex TaxID=1478 RepID=UPI0010BF2413|nr:hypothetical protein [Peribacillus simplex]TKH07325.1 hypothetical protein FC682_02015 [Peribacillus simplex]
MIDVNVEFDRKELEKLIREMDLYMNTKEVVSDYKEVANKLDERELILQQQKEELNEQLTQNTADQETSNVAEVVYLKIQAKKMVEELKIIDSLLIETKKEQEELKINYYKVYRRALSKDGTIAKGYDVTPLIDKVLSQTMAIIAEVGTEAKEQYSEIAPDIDELFGDSKVREVYPRILDESFDFDRHNLSYRGSKIVLEKHEIESATSGRIPDKFKEKDVR